MFKLLFLLFITLILLLKSQKESKIAFFGQKTDLLDFDDHKRFFLPDILLSILIFIIFFRLFILKSNIGFVYF